MNGVERIAAERARQVEQEGWTPEHDVEHQRAELINAAICYGWAAAVAQFAKVSIHFGEVDGQISPPSMWKWPWEAAAWKPSQDSIRNLEKAGALLAAEIDRLLAEQEARP